MSPGIPETGGDPEPGTAPPRSPEHPALPGCRQRHRQGSGRGRAGVLARARAGAQAGLGSHILPRQYLLCSCPCLSRQPQGDPMSPPLPGSDTTAVVAQLCHTTPSGWQVGTRQLPAPAPSPPSPPAPRTAQQPPPAPRDPQHRRGKGPGTGDAPLQGHTQVPREGGVGVAPTSQSRRDCVGRTGVPGCPPRRGLPHAGGIPGPQIPKGEEPPQGSFSPSSQAQ